MKLFFDSILKNRRYFCKQAFKLSGKEKIEITKFTEEHTDEVLQLVNDNLAVREPLTKSLKFLSPGKINKDFDRYVYSYLTQKHTCVAHLKYTNKIVGAVVCGIRAHGLKEVKDEKMMKILDFIEEISKKTDFEGFDHNHIGKIAFAAIDNACEGTDLSSALYNYTVDVLRKEANWRVMMAETTAAEAQAVLARHGWKVMKEVKYDEYPTKENPTFTGLGSDNKYFKLFMKRFPME